MQTAFSFLERQTRIQKVLNQSARLLHPVTLTNVVWSALGRHSGFEGHRAELSQE